MRTTLSLLLAFVFAACSAPSEEAGSPAEESAAETREVAWFHGSPDAAFARARTQQRPVFLYWGAEWCPPCHYLKDKVFHSPEFIERSERFLMVYLDGDTESAQTLGEELDVQGYPTVLVFSPEGEELFRMASDAPPSRYLALMERATRLDRPVQEILDEVLAAGPAAADPGDLDVLAHHSWGQDSRVGLDEAGRRDIFRRLWLETPEELAVERSRFLWLYVEAVAARDDESELEADERSLVREALLASLASPEEIRANVFGLSFAGGDAIEALTDPGSAERDTLVAAWDAAAAACEIDPELSLDDRLTCVAPRLELAGLGADEGAALPADLVQHARDRVAWAGSEAKDQSVLQAVLSTMVFVLREAGLDDEAETLLVERMADAHSPYYFMSYLASILKDADRADEALEWYRKAYDASQGRYSRFRWGSLYLRNLLELDPESIGRIDADTLAVLDELLAHDDAFAGGNYVRLGQLGRALESWRDDGGSAEVVAHARERVHAACEGYPDEGEDSARERCRGFLAETA